MSRMFLGLDSSTQSLTAVLVDYDTRRVAGSWTLSFDEALPRYGTKNGVLRGGDPRVVHAPPRMWVEALDLLLGRMKAEGAPLGSVLAIAGSGQQHGSVYLTAAAPSYLAALDPGRGLAEQLQDVFARATSPVWMDSSTQAECAEIQSALGGMRATAERTGSAAFERFTGPQIRKFWKSEPDAYARTAHVALVSSFMASLLAGRVAPIDHGDGAGMNLMNIRERIWDARALDATAPGLRGRLPDLAPSWQVIGAVSPYFVKKYDFNPKALACVWSGDNPCSVIGLGLVEPGMVAISLGTSDTYFGTMKDCHTDPEGEGHVFGAPTGGYMTLICFKNGSLARERVKDGYGLDWAGFAKAIESAPPGNGGRMMLPYFEPEIVPKVLQPGVRRHQLPEDDVAGNCRAVVEAQMMSMRIHSKWMGVRPSRIYATGGASRNKTLLQVMADVQGCPVHRFEVSNSAALGAALRAAHSYLAGSGLDVTWKDIAREFATPAGDVIRPAPATAAIYDAMEKSFAAFERRAIAV
jgi:xylulokinase